MFGNTLQAKKGERAENFRNIASISQTHLFYKFYIHISLSTHTPVLLCFVDQWFDFGI